MFFKLLLLFSVVPLVELYLLIKIGGVIGALNTVMIILITAIIGAWLARGQGFMVLGRIREAFQEGRPPARELIHGLFILIGAFTLLTPGFITDCLGLSMLVPPVRELYVKLVSRWIRKKFEAGDWHITI